MQFTTGWRRTKPKRPYRNLDDYARKICWPWKDLGDWRDYTGEKWPCRECAGQGTIYDPNDPPCPVEGNKMRDRIKCPKCSGSRCQSWKETREGYKEAIDKYKAEKEEYDHLVEHKKAALEKLSEEERKALIALGL